MKNGLKKMAKKEIKNKYIRKKDKNILKGNDIVTSKESIIEYIKGVKKVR